MININFILYNLVALPVLILAKLFLFVFSSKFRLRERKVTYHFKIPKDKKVVWIHSASMGEFDQARSVIKQLKLDNNNLFIVVTFFSPSGLENLKDFEYADCISYLPIDLPWNAYKFVNQVKPSLVVFIRYEFWYNFLYFSKLANSKIILLAASIPNSKIGRMAYKSLFQSFYDKIFAVNQSSKDFLGNNEIVELLPDARYDRINEYVISNQFDYKYLRDFAKEKRIIIFGSIWQEDTEVIQYYLTQNIDKYFPIFVPHLVDEDTLSKLANTFYNINLKRLSKINDIVKDDVSGIIVDSIGKLLGLYSIAHISYVGGAFGKGLHSVIEPAGYGKPVICGVNYQNSPEACNMIKEDVLLVVKNSKEFEKIMESLSTLDNYDEISIRTKNYFEKMLGSTNMIAKQLMNFLNSAKN